MVDCNNFINPKDKSANVGYMIYQRVMKLEAEKFLILL